MFTVSQTDGRVLKSHYKCLFKKLFMAIYSISVNFLYNAFFIYFGTVVKNLYRFISSN